MRIRTGNGNTCGLYGGTWQTYLDPMSEMATLTSPDLQILSRIFYFRPYLTFVIKDAN